MLENRCTFEVIFLENGKKNRKWGGGYADLGVVAIQVGGRYLLQPWLLPPTPVPAAPPSPLLRLQRPLSGGEEFNDVD